MSRNQSLDRTKAILSSVAVLVLAANVSQAKYSGGTGEPNSPYRIATPNDLNDIGNHVEDFNKCFVMINDINLADYNARQFNIIGNTTTKFIGVFDGNEHTISKFTYDTWTDCIGLFGYTDYPGQIRNLKMEDVNVVGGSYIGGCVGLNKRSTITNCSLTGSVSGESHVGGLVGRNDNGIIKYCCISASVSGDFFVGGLLGANYGGELVECHSLNNISGNMEYAGGLVGANYAGRLVGCHSFGNVNGDHYVGGLVGQNGDFYGGDCDEYGCWGAWGYGDILNSFSASDVSGNHCVGGVVGLNYAGEIKNTYFTNTIQGNSYVGGLVGFNYDCVEVCGYYLCELVCSGDMTIDKCYSSGSVSGSSYVGGLIGKKVVDTATDSFWDVETSGQSTSDGGEGKTTAEMKTKETFTNAGWDLVEVWDIGENQTYPFLRVYPAGDLNHDGIVNFIDVAILADHWLEGT